MTAICSDSLTPFDIVKRRPKFIDRTGQNFFRLTVISYAGKAADGSTVWNCLCDCGKTICVRGPSLRTGNTRSCGCLAIETPPHTTHGHSRVGKVSPELRAFHSMHQRCGNPKNPGWKHYGGRGIFVAPEWETFEQFWKDMGPRPSARHSIERQDNNGHYSKSNCIWQTPKQQARNKRTNHLVTFEGVTCTVTEWAEKLNIPRRVIYFRLKYGWSVNKALSAPVKNPHRLLEFQNRKQSIASWSREVGVSREAIWHRLNMGWSVSKALSTPARVLRKR